MVIFTSALNTPRQCQSDTQTDRQTDFTQRVIYFTVASYLASLLAKKIHIFYVVYLSVACDCKCAHEHM